MKEKYAVAYLAYIFPYPIHTTDYIAAISHYYEGVPYNRIKKMFTGVIEQRILFINNNHVVINPEYSQKIYADFQSKSEIIKKYTIDKFSHSTKSIFNASSYSKLVSTYWDAVRYHFLSEQSPDQLDQITMDFKDSLYNILSKGKDDTVIFHDIIRIFCNDFIDDVIIAKMINILYKFNQNSHSIYFYSKIKDKSKIDTETLIKISSAYFMTNNIETSKTIILDIEKNHRNDINIRNTLEIIGMMNRCESTPLNSQLDIVNKFKILVSNVSLSPNCANLLLKFSSTILPHEDAIALMTSSKLSEHILQVYNNLGALYLTVGYKNYLCTKDKKDILKAEKYLEFAKFISEEQKEYSPYLELNLLTLKLCKEFHKKSLSKKYSTLYKKYLQMIDKADSSYFTSIVYCNCYILELLTTKDLQKLAKYKKIITDISNNSEDPKIKEKIQQFLSFSSMDAKIPIWIITETHY